MKALVTMKDTEGRILIPEISERLQLSLRKYFTGNSLNSSRLESFYALLYLVAREVNSEEAISLDRLSAQNVLRASRVFPSSELIDSLQEVIFEWKPYSKFASWSIRLNKEFLKLPMNDGNGFRAFEHGFCQRVEALLLDGGFDFEVRENKTGNIHVKFKKPVDFYGEFGSRGIAHVEVNYVSLFEIEFLQGSKLGASITKIADREFERTDKQHSWFLKVIADLVSKRSTQTLDW